MTTISGPQIATHATLLALFLACFGCEKTKNTFVPPPAPTVTVDHAVPSQVAEVVECTGVAKAADAVEVRARVQGFISRIPMQGEEGRLVSEGDLLFEIDPRPFASQIAGAKASLAVTKARVQSARANVDQAKARTENAKAQYARARRAAESGAVTESELDDLRTTWQLAATDIAVAEAAVVSATAEVDVAQSVLDKSELDYEYTQVTAPQAGRLGERRVDLGALVGSGEPTLLTEIVSYDPVYVYFTIPETDFQRHLREAAAQGKTGASLAEEAPKQIARVGLSGEEGYPHEGHFDFADLEIDSATGTFQLRAEFENPDWMIRPGAFARVQIPLEEREVLLIDEAAVLRDSSGSYLIVVNAEDVAERRPVSVGRVINNQRVITDGVTAEDRIVVNGLQRARPGTQVAPTARPKTSEE